MIHFVQWQIWAFTVQLYFVCPCTQHTKTNSLYGWINHVNSDENLSLLRFCPAPRWHKHVRSESHVRLSNNNLHYRLRSVDSVCFMSYLVWLYRNASKVSEFMPVNSDLMVVSIDYWMWARSHMCVHSQARVCIDQWHYDPPLSAGYPVSVWKQVTQQHRGPLCDAKLDCM